jgi:hypothetical protein
MTPVARDGYQCIRMAISVENAERVPYGPLETINGSVGGKPNKKLKQWFFGEVFRCLGRERANDTFANHRFVDLIQKRYQDWHGCERRSPVHEIEDGLAIDAMSVQRADNDLILPMSLLQ